MMCVKQSDNIIPVDRGCYIKMVIPNGKCISALIKYCDSVSDKITFFISKDKIIIRTTNIGVIITESIIFTENLLDFELIFSEMMVSRLIEKSGTNYDSSKVYVEITFRAKELLNALGKTIKSKYLTLLKDTGKSTISISVEDSKTVNNIGFSRVNMESDMFLKDCDPDYYYHIVTFSLSSFTSSLKDLQKCYKPDCTVEMSYGVKCVKVNIFSGESQSSVYLGNGVNF